jgi:CHAT domain-containing protein
MRRRIPLWLRIIGGFLLLLAGVVLAVFIHLREKPKRPATVALNSTNPQALLREANYFAYLANWEKAEPYFARAGQLFAQRGDQRGALYCKISCDEADVQHGSYTAAESYLNRELKLPLVQNDPRLRLRCLTAKGMVDLNTNTAAAEYDWAQVLKIAEQLHDDTWKARATGWLGVLDFINGNSSGALEKVLEAILATRWHHDTAGESTFLTWLGNGLIALKRPSQGLRCENNALELERSNPDSPIPYQTVIAKVSALEGLGRDKEAHDLLAGYLTKARQTGTEGAQAEFLREEGQLAIKTDDVAAAEGDYEQAAMVAEHAALPRVVAEAMFSLTDLYRQQGDLTKAQTCVSEGIKALQEVETPIELPHYLAVEAELQEATHHYKQADALFAQAQDVVQGMLLDAPNPMVEASLVSMMSGIYVDHFRLAAVKLNDINSAFEIVEEARGRALADDLRSHRKWAREESGAVDPAEARIDDIQRQLRQPHTTEERAQLLSQLDEAEALLSNAQIQDAQISQLVPSRPISLGLFESSLPSDQLVLEYVLANPLSFCLSITHETAVVHTLPSRARIGAAIRKYLTNVETKKPASVLAKELYRWLLAACIGNSSAQRLVIVPDGELNDLPFDALVMPNGHYVLESQVVSVSPSATILHFLRGERLSSAARPFLGVGYTRGPELASAGAPLPDLVERAVHGIFGLGNPILSSLPYSRQEVEEAAQLMGPGSAVLLGSNATKGNIEAEPLGDFKILHFAVHGVIDAEDPDRSALVFREGKAPGDDGLLQAWNIRRLSLNADLVTLSACSTGVGKIEGEEGVDSLTAAFLMAGARSVLSSLWAVNDRWTATLMDKFYHNLAQGMDESTALESGKLEILKQYGRGTVPDDWAGFVLIGRGNARIMRGENADPPYQK